MARPRPRRQTAVIAGVSASVVLAAALAGFVTRPPDGEAGRERAPVSLAAVPSAGTRVAATPSAPRTAPGPSGPPASATPSTAPPRVPPRFGGGLLIADRGNGRLLVVDERKNILWSFPGRSSLPRGQHFSADDAFLAPDGRSIVANDEAHQVIDRIDIATGRVIWQYGRYDHAGAGAGYLHTPDDAYPLANGDIVVADIRNCRILELTPAKRIARQWGHTLHCLHRPPTSFAQPNGDTPLADGGILITEITGSRVVRLDRSGRVVFDLRAPVRYPSDAQLDGDGNVVVVDYSNPGAVLRLRPDGHILWRYRPTNGVGRLDHPSLALPLPDGTIVLNDDFRHRVVVIDPRTNRIVWQYGHADRAGRAAGYLNTPDGICLIPAGTVLP